MLGRVKELFSLKERYQELSNTVEYLMLNQLNAQASLEIGDLSNVKLRTLFLELVKRLKPSILCDIGTHDGESAVQVKQTLPNCQCYAFEANPSIHAKFKDDPRLSQVSYLNLAISDRTEVVKIFAPKMLSKAVINYELVDATVVEAEDTGKTSLRQRNESATYTEFAVQAYALDEFWQTQKIVLQERSLVLWVDVEGAADKVLQGATTTLKHAAMILIEVENYSFWQGQKKCHQIAQELMKSGFIPVARDREYADKQFNILFIHSTKISTIY